MTYTDSGSSVDSSSEQALSISDETLQVLSFFEGRVFQVSEIKRIENKEIILLNGLVLRQTYSEKGFEQALLQNRKGNIVITSHCQDNETAKSLPSFSLEIAQTSQFCVGNLSSFQELFREAVNYTQILSILLDRSRQTIIAISISANPANFIGSAPTVSISDDEVVFAGARQSNAVSCASCAKCIRDLGGTSWAKAMCCSFSTICPSLCPQCTLL
ncbi:MAG: hypothetical protein WA902_21415 [Thermosynechococcaceae cyanobacterium]